MSLIVKCDRCRNEDEAHTKPPRIPEVVIAKVQPHAPQRPVQEIGGDFKVSKRMHLCDGCWVQFERIVQAFMDSVPPKQKP